MREVIFSPGKGVELFDERVVSVISGEILAKNFERVTLEVLTFRPIARKGIVLFVRLWLATKATQITESIHLQKFRPSDVRQ